MKVCVSKCLKNPQVVLEQRIKFKMTSTKSSMITKMIMMMKTKPMMQLKITGMTIINWV